MAVYAVIAHYDKVFKRGEMTTQEEAIYYYLDRHTAEFKAEMLRTDTHVDVLGEPKYGEGACHVDSYRVAEVTVGD